MAEPKGLLKLNKNFRVFLLVVVFVAIICLIVRNVNTFGNILKVVIGFGLVVLVHEFGHFIVAKLSGIKVEAFSIGFHPILVGIRRIEGGYRIRVLPRFFPKENDESGDGSLSFTIGKKVKAGETEYRIGLIPFGGFNKMLGQDDTGPVRASDDPRSYANKPVSTRMAVIAAGVVLNAISAILIFMIVFLVGINRCPAVVGGLVPNSPAARVGLKAGDEIIEIAGKSDNLDFTNVIVAAALSDRNEKVALKVKRKDGSIKDFALVAEQLQGEKTRGFGIWMPQSLTIAKVSDVNTLFERTGLLAGYQIKSVNGREVQTYWELEQIVQNALVPAVTILAERTDPVSEKVKLIKSQIGLALIPAERKVKSEFDLGHIYSMMPRLRIDAVSTEPPSIVERLLSLFSGEKKDKDTVAGGELQSGDIILAIGDIENPTYKEMREVTTEYENRKLPIKVLRVDSNGTEKKLAVTVTPKRSKDGQVVIGIYLIPAFDAEHPVVAKTIAAEGGPAALEIPRGALVTAVDGIGVSNFYEIIAEIRKNLGQRISIDYRLDEEIAGNVALNVGAGKNLVTVRSVFAEYVPFELLRRLYKASGPVDAIVIGCKKMIMFIAQTYVSIKCLVSGLVGPRELSGPVGIIAMSYRIAAKQPLVDYAYWFGVISVLIAVFNCLPIPPFDGGHIVLLVIEKVKGSALSERVQGAIAYAGLVFIVALFIYLTFNDILNFFR